MLKGKFKRSSSSKPTQANPSHPTAGVDQAALAFDRIAKVCSSVSLFIPGLKEAADISMQIIKVAQVCGVYPFITRIRVINPVIVVVESPDE
jgi:hypothetical protein